MQAIEYYKEFVQLAPKDSGRYVLQYKLYEAQEVSLEERIAVLEEFKKKDYREKWAYELAYLYEYLNITCKEEIPDALIRAAYASTADLAIIQMQDILKLGNEARMNAPSTVGFNWRWRLGKEQLDDSRRAWIRKLAAVYRR